MSGLDTIVGPDYAAARQGLRDMRWAADDRARDAVVLQRIKDEYGIGVAEIVRQAYAEDGVAWPIEEARIAALPREWRVR